MRNILTRLVESQIEHYGTDRVAFSEVILNEDSTGYLKDTTWGSFASDVKALACAFEILGINEAEMLAVFSPNAPEILITDFACFHNRAVPVSIYATSSPDQVKYIINDCSARIVCVGEEVQYRTLRKVIDQCPSVIKVLVFNNDIEIDSDDTLSIHFCEALEMGRKASQQSLDIIAQRAAKATPDDIATLIYTSGTTGEPKGAILTHSCFDAAMRLHLDRLTSITDEDTSICFLPLSHIFEKAWTYFCLTKGMKVMINRNTKRIQEALKIARPTCMCSVPRFWEKVYTGIQEKIAKMKGIQRILVEKGLKVAAKRNLEYKRLGLKAPWWLEKKYQFFDKVIFSKIRSAIGFDKGNIFPTAGAPLSPNIVEFLQACGLFIMIGYGLSETTATVSCFPYAGYTIGSIGTCLPEVQVRLGDNNEILVKGPTVMKGYYRRDEETANAFTEDGWFRTGDAGCFDETGALVLTERLKDLFKTSNGKYIAPQAIESRLGEDMFIEQVAVIGDQRKYVTAIIIPSFSALKDYAARHNISFSSLEDLVNNSQIRQFIAERIEKLQNSLANFEKIKRFTLLPREFSIERGELTNTLKIRRAAINAIYSSEIEAMYC